MLHFNIVKYQDEMVHALLTVLNFSRHRLKLHIFMSVNFANACYIQDSISMHGCLRARAVKDVSLRFRHSTMFEILITVKWCPWLHFGKKNIIHFWRVAFIISKTGRTCYYIICSFLTFRHWEVMTSTWLHDGELTFCCRFPMNNPILNLIWVLWEETVTPYR